MLEPRKLFSIFSLAFCFSLLVTALGCSGQRSSTNATPTPVTQQQSKNEASPPQNKSAASAGQATGSYTAGGETVELKYAYAGRGKRFNEESVIVLVTDLPIPPEAVSEEIESQTMLLDKKIRGLEYVFSKDGYWVRYHPGQYQESKSGTIKEYSVENDVVKGNDEDAGDFTNGKYKRSVKFVATISK
ncbi:MAG: hypothetical protein QOI77_2987 [Blastocatellia bacterium]|jgi:hypothetical protein|nr:hypothetical protein [Blastocatellia bacterium]